MFAMARTPARARHRIAVLMHERDDETPPGAWIIVAIAEVWRAMGHEVEFVRGTRNPIDADLVVPHVDLSVLPDDYVRLLSDCPRVVNRRVVDIRKRAISESLVKGRREWNGPVIVKTDLNYGGYPERMRLRKPWWEKRVVRRLMRVLLRADERTGFHPFQRLEPDAYPIFESVADLPRGTFSNPSLVVERFLPERAGELYCLRCYAFAGTAEVNVRVKSASPVVKANSTLEREELPVTEELRALRRRLGFDYGKLDHVVVDGRLHLLDANRTPSFATTTTFSQRRTELTELFARGLLEQFGLGAQAAPIDTGEREQGDVLPERDVHAE